MKEYKIGKVFSKIATNTKCAIGIAGIILSANLAHALDISSDNSSISREDASKNQNSVYSYNNSIKDAIKTVVNITTEKTLNDMGNSPFNDPFFKQFFGDMMPQDKMQGGIGSGIIIQSDGYIVTNSHVVSGADKITVTLPGDKKKYSAKLIGNDPQSDIAVIKIDKNNLPTLKFADSSKYLVGDVVFAIGNPFGVGESVTQGIISALDKHGFGISNYENFIQTDASINPGNSGGALIDTRGYLIGMNTAIISKTGGNHGVGFAIPSSMLIDVTQKLVKTGKVVRGFLGITPKDLDSDVSNLYGTTNGVLVVGIEADSPAQRSGLQFWDVITQINGNPVKSASDLRNMIGAMRPGDNITLNVLRKVMHGNKQSIESRKINVTLTNQKQETKSTPKVSVKQSQEMFDGLTVDNISNQIRNVYRIPKEINGVFVSDVKNNSKASMMGFEQGDVIAQIENYKIKDVNDFKNAIKALDGKTKRVLVYNMMSGEIKTIVAN